MSAAATQAPLPLFKEGLSFWDDLARECRRQMDAINKAARDNGLSDDQLVEWLPGRNIGLLRKAFPSTEIRASLAFQRWGPVINVEIQGHQHEDMRFYPEEQEVPLGSDEDGGTVAILGEGRSYSPCQFAAYLSQSLRRCFPAIALPCPEYG